MKRVGIITFHKPNNYGANLQAFALQEFIRELGYEVKIIDYRNKIIENTNKLIKANSGIKNLVKSLIFLPKNISRRRNFEHFRKQNYCLSKSYTNKVQIENSNEKFDVYIAGSDQLWNTKITKIVDDFYTLNFNVGQAKKVSYATSLANVDMKEEEIKEIANRINQYDNISVRESRAKEVLEKYIDKEISIMIDPTLLLNKDIWEKFAKEKIIKEEYILLYTIVENDEIFKILNRLSEITGLKVITLRRTNLKTKNILKNLYTEGPDAFIELFKNAKYIVTSSFHGTAFSIIFNKKFFVNYGGKDNKRVDNILNICGLQDRLIRNVDELDKEKIERQIDYKTVNEIIETERKKAKDYLVAAIKGDVNEK